MSFLRRLTLYLLGVGLGTLVVFYLFADREFQCSYFPNARVLANLREQQRVVPDEVLAALQENQLDTASLSAMLRGGKVDFEKSHTKRHPCLEYWIDYYPENKKGFSAEWQLCDKDSTATILKIEFRKLSR